MYNVVCYILKESDHAGMGNDSDFKEESNFAL